MKDWLLNYIFKNAVYLRLVALLQRIKLGRNKVGLYDAVVIFLQKMYNDELLDRANAVAFSFTMAIFPAIIFLFTLTPYIQDFFPAVDNHEIIGFLKTILPRNLYLAAEATITDIIGKQRGGLLSFGFVMTLILSTNGMTALMSAFNSCYKTVDTRGFLKKRIVAVILIFVLSISIIVSIALLVVGQQFLSDAEIRSVVAGNISIDLIIILRFIFLYTMFQFTISSIYYLAPAVHEKWHFLSIGSVFSSLACILASFGFSYYVNNFGTYNKLYGSIGVLLVLMLWLFIISLILLVGFEMNAAMDQARIEQRKLEVKSV